MADIIDFTYEVIKKLGAGGGGNVYLANHLRLGKLVVLKADKRKITTRQELLRREVDVLKDLSHPYIPKVYDFFVEAGTVYTVMDYIKGESLDKPLKRGEKFSQPQVIKWAGQLLDALCYLHSPTHGTPPRGFVHSDIKPANLMRTPDNDICLIDFNIALALGEENVIGCSAGYASPEHYGLDFSTGSDTVGGEDVTSVLDKEDDEDPTFAIDRVYERSLSGSSKKLIVVPDIRSDIYSTGATLYHLLSGRRPARNAKNVTPLSEEEFSPQLVRIITKAMNPNPDLRYQTAEEMLWDFSHLRERDPRVRRQRRSRIAAGIVFATAFTLSAAAAFIGLKRMQTTESWLKLVQYSKNALEEGDADLALDYALQSFPTGASVVEPGYIAQAQRALTSALGVYDLSDGYKSHETVSFPSAPLYMSISPNGKTACCVYAYTVAVFDTSSAQILAALPAEQSALAEVEYLDDSTIVYAGEGGIKAYDIETGRELWTGRPATAISVSGDRISVAAVYKDESFATVYDAHEGSVKYTVDFQGRNQRVTVNDSFANPNDSLLALNEDGAMLGVSFEDGSLEVYSLLDREEDIVLFDDASDYTHFEGGFYKQYFAFSAAGPSDSIFAVIDTKEQSQTGGFESENIFHVQADDCGIYVQTDNLLVKIHPVTGEQTPLITTSETIRIFARSGPHTLAASQNKFMFFDANANQNSAYESEYECDFVQLSGNMALIGSRDSSAVRIMRYENHPDTELFSYNPSYQHDEARVSGDKKTVMLFSYDEFRLYGIDGKLIKAVSIPNADQVYDQQYVRDGENSWLEVIYNDGTVFIYSAKDGSLLKERAGEKPDGTLFEEFYTDRLRIESPLHGAPAVYDNKSQKLVARLEEDDYLTYVTQAGNYIITQYVTAAGFCYGQLLNEKCEVLADLPYLSDIIGDTLIFDYPTGNMRESRIYDIDELMEMARKKSKGGNGA